MIFEPDTLQGMPATYMTSFSLATSNERELVELARAFPSVTLLRGRRCWPSCAASSRRSRWRWSTYCCSCWWLAVLFAGLQATLDERIRRCATARAKGRTAFCC